MEKEKLIDLVSRAKAGEGEAVNDLFTAFYGDVYYFALKTVKDEQVAQDVTQETFVEIINTIEELKEPAAFVSWLKQITYHQCTRYFKKKKDVIVDEDEGGGSVFDTVAEDNAEFIPDEALDKKDFKATVLSLLDELSPEQHAAVMLYYFDELSVTEIAKIQGVSTGTVKSRLNYGRKAIKEAVAEYEKKNGVKLHSVPFIPLVLWLLKGTASKAVPASVASGVAEGVSTATGTAVAASAAGTSVAAGSTAAASATAASASGVAAGASAASAAGTAAAGIGVKIAAIAVAASVAVGGLGAAGVAGVVGITALVASLNGDDDSSDNEDKQPVEAYGIILRGNLPKGCTYYTASGEVLTEGDPFPDECTEGDIVEYQDYVYGYECIKNPEYNEANTEKVEEIVYFSQMNGDYDDMLLTESDVTEAWFPVVRDRTKSEYGPIVSEINGKPIKGLFGTYAYCTGIKNLSWFNPNMPRLTYMISTFFGSSLEDAADLKFPQNVENICASFYGCASLSNAPMIPEGINKMEALFRECTTLKGKVCIDANPQYFDSAFSATVLPIDLIGKSDMLDEIAATAENGNVTVLGGGLPENGGEDNGDEVTEGYVVPDGFVYTRFDGTTYAAGEAITVMPEIGDSMTNGIYLYTYGKERTVQKMGNDDVIETTVSEMVSPCWSVYAEDVSLSSYPALQKTINGEPLCNLNTAFMNCKNMKTAPAIPSSVAEMKATFAYCTALETAPVLPEDIRELYGTFYLCSALKAAPEIPSDVYYMGYTFYRCSSMTAPPKLPENLTNLGGTFQYCSKLQSAPVIPDGVTDVSYAFLYCTSLTQAPTIPASVNYLMWTFGHCTSLTGTVRVHSANITDPEQMRNILYGTTKSIILYTDCEYGITKQVATECGGNVQPKSSLGTS